MREEQKVTCIVCPLGCEVTVTMQENMIVQTLGHACMRGEKYAAVEVIDPRRTLTSTVRVQQGSSPLVSVKSAKPIPKALLFAAMKSINGASVKAPVKIGDVVVQNVAGTGVDIVATTDVA
jgi:CxxC motif-containing protein